MGDSACGSSGCLAPRGTSIGMNLDESSEVPVETALRMFNRTGFPPPGRGAHPTSRSSRRAGPIIEMLRDRHDGEEDVTVLTQDAVLAAFDQILAALTAALGRDRRDFARSGRHRDHERHAGVGLPGAAGRSVS